MTIIRVDAFDRLDPLQIQLVWVLVVLLRLLRFWLQVSPLQVENCELLHFFHRRVHVHGQQLCFAL